MIKGHAVIELKDESTGKIWRTEHDNMITNGLKYALTPWLGKFSYANAGPNSEFQIMTSENKETRKSQNRSIMNHLLGGVFLFQNPLTEDVDNVAFPNDNPLTGKASWDAYSGMDTSRGSYNESESGMQEDGSYKHVWDFNTQQANGQISALSLTTYMGGICGDGFADWDFNTENAIAGDVMLKLGSFKLKNSFDRAPLIFSNSKDNAIYFTNNNNQLYYINGYTSEHIGNSGKLVLEKIKAPLTKISPFYDYYNQYLTEQVEISIPSDFAAYVNGKQCVAYTTDSYVYIWREYGWGKNENVLILQIDKSNLTATVLNITFGIENIQYQGARIAFTDKYVFFMNNNYNMYRFNLTNSDLSAIEYTQFKEASWIIYAAGYIYTYPYSGYKFYCINEETLEVKKHPTISYYRGNNSTHVGWEKIAPNIYLRGEAANNPLHTGVSAYLMSNSLMTINNLPSPVVKTASQSMKITYTIQETDTEI